MKKYYKMLCIPATADNRDRSKTLVYTSTHQGAAPAGWRCIAVLGYFEKTGRVKED